MRYRFPVNAAIGTLFFASAFAAALAQPAGGPSAGVSPGGRPGSFSAPGTTPAPPVETPPAPPSGSVSIEPDVDRPGADYAAFGLTNADPLVCRAACAQDARCVAYTYVKPGVQAAYASCWLKAQAPQPYSNACCISGTR